MKKTFTMSVLLGLAFSFAFLGSAAAVAPKTPEAGLSRTRAVSFYFNRPADDIAGLRAAGFGYGEIVKIFVIAEMSRSELKDLLAENRKGYGWGAISLKLGLNPVFVKMRVDSARRDLNIKVRPAAEAGKS